jgi:hypothetical protein
MFKLRERKNKEKKERKRERNSVFLESDTGCD